LPFGLAAADLAGSFSNMLCSFTRACTISQAG
jgi:hypothetical protein